MIAVAFCITAGGVILGTVPQLRRHIMLHTNDENPNGIAVPNQSFILFIIYIKHLKVTRQKHRPEQLAHKKQSETC